MGEELKPCPFCGSANVDFDDLGDPGNFEDLRIGRCFVRIAALRCFHQARKRDA